VFFRGKIPSNSKGTGNGNLDARWAFPIISIRNKNQATLTQDAFEAFVYIDNIEFSIIESIKPDLGNLDDLDFGSTELGCESIIPALDDSTILSNQEFSASGSANFGGRKELMSGATNEFNYSKRHILLRYDPKSERARISNPEATLLSAKLVMTHREGRAIPSKESTLVVRPLVVENSGWIEGTRETGSIPGSPGEAGSVSLNFISTPSFYENNEKSKLDGLQWHSAGGGSSEMFLPLPFTLGLDTGLPVGFSQISSSSYSETGEVEIPLDPSRLRPLLQSWLDNPATNPGLIISEDSNGIKQWFFESNEGNSSKAPKLKLVWERGRRPRNC